MGGFTEVSPGLVVGHVSVDDFRQFAARFGTSDEVGPIGTYYDAGKDAQEKQNADKVRLFGLRACHLLIAVACFTLSRSRESQAYSCKLDSVIVRPNLRKQGLGGLLVSHGFAQLLETEEEGIVTIYAHSVHPATVKLLRRHGFSDPNPVGAPISSFSVTDGIRQALLISLKERERTSMTRLKHKCLSCVNRKKGAVKWCQVR